MFAMSKLALGIDFGRALVDHFGLPRDKVDVGLSVNASRNDIFDATLMIALTADDLPRSRSACQVRRSRRRHRARANSGSIARAYGPSRDGLRRLDA
jgi:hypothetical protein